MKNKYAAPVMKIDRFSEENIVTNSTVLKEIKDRNLTIDGKSGENINLFSFDFTL